MPGGLDARQLSALMEGGLGFKAHEVDEPDVFQPSGRHLQLSFCVALETDRSHVGSMGVTEARAGIAFLVIGRASIIGRLGKLDLLSGAKLIPAPLTAM